MLELKDYRSLSDFDRSEVSEYYYPLRQGFVLCYILMNSLFCFELHIYQYYSNFMISRSVKLDCVTYIYLFILEARVRTYYTGGNLYTVLGSLI